MLSTTKNKTKTPCPTELSKLSFGHQLMFTLGVIKMIAGGVCFVLLVLSYPYWPRHVGLYEVAQAVFVGLWSLFLGSVFVLLSTHPGRVRRLATTAMTASILSASLLITLVHVTV